MSDTIPAIYDAGVFRPLQPVDLVQGTQVELQLKVTEQAAAQRNDGSTANSWLEFVDQMELLPDNSPRDGLSNRDHDRIIYGS